MGIYKFDLEASLKKLAENNDLEDHERFFWEMEMRCIDQFTNHEQVPDITFDDDLTHINPIPKLEYSDGCSVHILGLHQILRSISCERKSNVHYSICRLKRILGYLAEEGFEEDEVFEENCLIIFQFYERVIGGISDLVSLVEIGLVEKAIDMLVERTRKDEYYCQKSNE